MFKPNYIELKNKLEDLVERDRKEIERDKSLFKGKKIVFFDAMKRSKKDRLISIIPFLRRDAS